MKPRPTSCTKASGDAPPSIVARSSKKMPPTLRLAGYAARAARTRNPRFRGARAGGADRCRGARGARGGRSSRRTCGARRVASRRVARGAEGARRGEVGDDAGRGGGEGRAGRAWGGREAICFTHYLLYILFGRGGGWLVAPLFVARVRPRLVPLAHILGGDALRSGADDGLQAQERERAHVR
jgi:hypothetical protein